ncbi:MAG: bifunctional phosphopantothenoylcysteine decarboxylase/phosphopantothenate--cysteine ligase CoaBC [Melioribacteraceae bacterium]|nr:bifunctional phosphopantothenoylcysteine decarboxylase/phosphopantothenate--cysteine ligase CoaBC [Melioribacteraceae bacterium]MCF8353705.1 bifunctional phosphopantothenoylcysteine decarboxylase/phosphopantothenate--cysteine ligase CoaBC [Melioribacteraceae bacterium]MCF8394958.1 bifunctional phosphopantothenoylcysteine decarboxylase/phosphopantothenate--cysteine ligase CoaBC [Melioribacteraceae bacterium]MCF8418621.1 bifunctional phosphopantothenoylcysteine decarboxylase/phosphopantothenate
MLKNKILLKISGSIAAYKSAYLISKLVQNGFEVQTVATESALRFIGKATLEGLTGKPVMTDSFADGEMMSHINLVKWADIVVLAPASANTINKLSAGIGDNLLTSLFLAHDWSKPYLIAPAMNTNMYQHPATTDALNKLRSWGVIILPTASGHLACGDIGKGKLLDPDMIFERIESLLKQNTMLHSNGIKVLITSGGTRENIDGVRYLSNLSTGKTGAVIADALIKSGYDITYLHSIDAALPAGVCRKIEFSDFRNLDSLIQSELKNNFNAVIHLAAVSDFSVSQLILNGETKSIPLKEKITSSVEEISLVMKPNYKIVDRIKDYSINKNLLLFSFKFTNGGNIEPVIEKQFRQSKSDYIIHNDLKSRMNNTQTSFGIYKEKFLIDTVKTSGELGNKIVGLIQKNK